MGNKLIIGRSELKRLARVLGCYARELNSALGAEGLSIHESRELVKKLEAFTIVRGILLEDAKKEDRIFGWRHT